MTVYVDNFRVPARVGRVRGRWSHLVTDNPDINELHEFAERIGLRRQWFQPVKRHPHYDVTDSMRQAAIDAGAVSISFRDLPAVFARARGENPASQEGHR